MVIDGRYSTKRDHQPHPTRGDRQSLPELPYAASGLQMMQTAEEHAKRHRWDPLGKPSPQSSAGRAARFSSMSKCKGTKMGRKRIYQKGFERHQSHCASHTNCGGHLRNISETIGNGNTN